MTWSPDFNVSKTAEIAAMPDANANPYLPFSRLANFSSKIALFGLPLRA